MPGRNARGFAAAAGRSFLALAAMTVMALLVPVGLPSALAGATADIRVIPGAAGSLSTGSVLRGQRDVYRLAAPAGQTLKVEIVSVEENAVFQIYLPGKGGRTMPGAGPMDDATTWKGQLPVAGTYRIVVGGTRGNAEYTLRVDAVE